MNQALVGDRRTVEIQIPKLAETADEDQVPIRSDPSEQVDSGKVAEVIDADQLHDPVRRPGLGGVEDKAILPHLPIVIHGPPGPRHSSMTPTRARAADRMDG